MPMPKRFKIRYLSTRSDGFGSGEHVDVRFWSMDGGETVYATHGILFPFDEHGGIVNIMDVDRCIRSRVVVLFSLYII